MDTKNCVIYCRQSTGANKQRNSISIQIDTMRAFAKSNGYTVIAEYKEYLSGTIVDRPVLMDAIKHAVKEDAFILILRVDRLMRDLKGYALIEPYVDRFRFAQLGDRPVDLFTFTVLLSLAQNESKIISLRTSMAMRKLRDNDGRSFGNPNIASFSKKGVAVRRDNAIEFAEKANILINDFITLGYKSNQALTDKLNSINFTTRNGKPWTPSNLYRLRCFIRRNL